MAVLIAAVGSLATLGFAPTISLVRFEYATLALSLLGAFARRLPPRRRPPRPGPARCRRGAAPAAPSWSSRCSTPRRCAATARPSAVDSLLDAVRWCRAHLGAFPRPVEAVLGIPALAWGVHMRARRRQGWWVCAFGAAGTAAVANALVNPAIGMRECGLSVLYGLVVGLVIGFVVIRADLALGGTGAGRATLRGARRGAPRAAPHRLAHLRADPGEAATPITLASRPWRVSRWSRSWPRWWPT